MSEQAEFEKLVKTFVEGLYEEKLDIHYLFSAYYQGVIVEGLKILRSDIETGKIPRDKGIRILNKIKNEESLNEKYKNAADKILTGLGA